MPAEFRDYYKVLGVNPNATDEDIRKAFRNLARKYHPDVAKDKATAEDRFKEINEAHEVLSDPESRRKYDQLGAGWKSGANPEPPSDPSAWRTGGAPAGNNGNGFHFEGTGFSDFFERYFGGRSGPGRGASPFGDGATGFRGDGSPGAQRGQDIHGDLLIQFDEALHGAVRVISIRREDAGNETEGVDRCHVRIPAGVQSGQSIRIPGKGGAGVEGGAPGDIFLNVRYARHPDWTAHGTDLMGTLDLAPWEAVLGTTLSVPTLEGSVKVKVPPGTRQGQRLRVRGQGLPAGSGSRGDLYVEILLQVPTHSSEAALALWKQLAQESGFDPRRPENANGSTSGPGKS
jgi:curved DNA-binding protein